MAKRKPQTQLEKEYTKELRRIKAFIAQASKRGYTFDESIIPPKPKKVTKATVRKLKQITPKTLYQKAEFLNPKTGAITTGIEGRQFERRLAADKGQLTKAIKATTQKQGKQTGTTSLPRQSKIVLGNVRDIINTWSPPSHWSEYWVKIKEVHKNKLEALLDKAISSEGEDLVARRLEETAVNVLELADRICYGSLEEQVEFDLVHFATIILGRSLTQDESAELTEVEEAQEEH